MSHPHIEVKRDYRRSLFTVFYPLTFYLSYPESGNAHLASFTTFSPPRVMSKRFDNFSSQYFARKDTYRASAY